MQITKVLGRKDGGSLAVGLLLAFLSLEAIQSVAQYLTAVIFNENLTGTLKASILAPIVALVLSVVLVEGVLRLLNRKK